MIYFKKNSLIKYPFFSEMSSVWKYLSVMIFVQVFIFIYFLVRESNDTITIHKGERIQVEERNHGSDHNQSKETKIYRGKTSTKSQFLSYLTKTKLMMANDTNHLPSHMVFANMLILQEHT